MTRPEIVGPEHLDKPYPLLVDTFVTSGFGRGSTELGFPTANIEPEFIKDLAPGIYYGWARLAVARPGPERDEAIRLENKQEKEAAAAHHTPKLNFGEELGDGADKTFPMVMSIGWNPFFKNERKSAEAYIIHDFNCKFYGARIKVAVLGFIREEQSYDSLQDLVDDIKTDVRVALNSLARPAYQEAGRGLEE